MSGGVQRQEKERATDEVTEVAPGVIRTQLPIDLPGLGHVNCYLLEDERGLAVVDPGLPDDATYNALVSRLKTAGYKPDDIHTVVATHSHSDHYGGAWRLMDEHGAQLLTHTEFGSWVTADEDDEFAEIEPLNEEGLPRPPWERFPKTAWGTRREPPPQIFVDEWYEKARQGKASFVPDPTITVRDTEVVKLARREWVAVHTPGHTFDHLCLYDPVEKIMLSGDHVLPTITPHVGGDDGDHDTLALFMDSLKRMHDFSDVEIVLPAHGHPFTDLAGRAGDICDHHVERLDEIRDTAQSMETATVTEYCLLYTSPSPRDS